MKGIATLASLFFCAQEEKRRELSMRIVLSTSGQPPRSLPLLSEAGAPLTFALLHDVAAEMLHDDTKAFALCYVDADGDEVTIARDADVKELTEYMSEELMEHLTVAVVPRGVAASRRAAPVPTMGCDLRPAMSELTISRPTQPTPANAINVLVARLQAMDVANWVGELVAIKQQWQHVLQDEALKHAVETLCASSELKEVMGELMAAIDQEDTQAMEELVATRWDELLVVAQRLMVCCPTLEPAVVSGSKKAMTGFVRLNDLEATEGDREARDGRRVEARAVAIPIHAGIFCDGCGKTPVVGTRYKSFGTPDFDLCQDCEASGKWAMHEPFIKITDPSRAVKDYSTLTVHPFVVCDGCRMNPILGLRFQSMTEPDFDLCGACQASGKWTESHGPFTQSQEPPVRQALNDPSRGEERYGHGKSGRHFGKSGNHYGYGKFGRHGPHGPPGIPFRCPEAFHHRRTSFEGPGFERERLYHLKFPYSEGFGYHDLNGGNESNISSGLRSCGSHCDPPACPLEVSVDGGSQDGSGCRGHHEHRKNQVEHENEASTRWPLDSFNLKVGFVEDVTIKDGTIVKAGQSLRKMWKLVNDGECSWPVGCYMATTPDNIMISNLCRIDLPPLAPNEEFIAEVDMVAPTQPGRYTSYWRVCDPTNKSFGHRFWVDILVEKDAILQPEAPTAETVTDSDLTKFVKVSLAAEASVDDDIEIIEAADVIDINVKDVEVKGVANKANESLQLLSAMGFLDLAKNRRALEMADGSVAEAVAFLLSE